MNKLFKGLSFILLATLFSACSKKQSIEEYQQVIRNYIFDDIGSEYNAIKSVEELGKLGIGIDSNLLASTCDNKKIDFLLLSGADINYHSINLTPLSEAAISLDIECVEALLKRGADPFIESNITKKSSKYTALEWATDRPGIMDVVYSPNIYLYMEKSKTNRNHYLQSKRNKIIEILKNAMDLGKK